jgi:hypothetical protein
LCAAIRGSAVPTAAAANGACSASCLPVETWLSVERVELSSRVPAWPPSGVAVIVPSVGAEAEEDGMWPCGDGSSAASKALSRGSIVVVSDEPVCPTWDGSSFEAPVVVVAAACTLCPSAAMLTPAIWCGKMCGSLADAEDKAGPGGLPLPLAQSSEADLLLVSRPPMAGSIPSLLDVADRSMRALAPPLPKARLPLVELPWLESRTPTAAAPAPAGGGDRAVAPRWPPSPTSTRCDVLPATGMVEDALNALVWLLWMTRAGGTWNRLLEPPALLEVLLPKLAIPIPPSPPSFAEEDPESAALLPELPPRCAASGIGGSLTTLEVAEGGSADSGAEAPPSTGAAIALADEAAKVAAAGGTGGAALRAGSSRALTTLASSPGPAVSSRPGAVRSRARGVGPETPATGRPVCIKPIASCEGEAPSAAGAATSGGTLPLAAPCCRSSLDVGCEGSVRDRVAASSGSEAPSLCRLVCLPDVDPAAGVWRDLNRSPAGVERANGLALSLGGPAPAPLLVLRATPAPPAAAASRARPPLEACALSGRPGTSAEGLPKPSVDPAVPWPL